MLTQERINQLFEYDFDTGNLVWKVNRGTSKKGSIAGSVNSEGYLCVGIDGNVYHVHRVVWIYVNGSMPIKGMIDHINRDKKDNRFSNLRMATSSENNRNTGLRRDNKSGVRGVSFISSHNKWRVSICGKHFGEFSCKEDAVRLRNEKAREIFGEFFC